MCTKPTCFLLHALATRKCFVEFLEVVNFWRMAKVSLNLFAGPWANPDELLFFRFPGVLASSGSIGEVGIRGCGCSLVEFPYSHFEQVIELGIVREVDWKQLGSMGHQRHQDMSSLFSKDAGWGQTCLSPGKPEKRWVFFGEKPQDLEGKLFLGGGLALRGTLRFPRKPFGHLLEGGCFNVWMRVDRKRKEINMARCWWPPGFERSSDINVFRPSVKKSCENYWIQNNLVGLRHLA